MKKIIALFITSLFGMVIYSCNKNYLEKRAPGQLDDASLANLHGVEGLLIGAYSLLDGSGGNRSDIASAGSNWQWGSVCGSEAYTGSNPEDGGFQEIEEFKSTAASAFTASKWGTLYDGEARCNDVLRMMKRATDISAEDLKRIEGEARFLRAYYHFEAKKMWGKVPFIDETITYEAGNYRAGNDTSIWPKIENDLKYAISNLPESQTEIGRANSFTATALLAKAYMFDHNYDAAKPLLETIINSGRYNLTKSFHDNFDPEKKNNEESIFSVQMSVNDGTGGQNGDQPDQYNFPAPSAPSPPVPGGCCGFFQPSQYLVNHFKTNAITGLPDLDHYNDVNVKYDSALLSSDDFSPYAGTLDPRLDWTVGRRGIPYLDWGINPGSAWIRNTNNGGPYLPLKNIYAKSQQSDFTDNANWAPITTALNLNLIRFADILLWAAEAEAETGNPDQAEIYVNRIRERAADSTGWVHTYVDAGDPSKGFTNTPAANYFIKPYPAGEFASKGKEYALKAIRYERMLELAMEGHRFFDLVRWGIASPEIKAYISKEKTMRSYMNDMDFKEGCNEYFPIPQLQIDLSAGADGIKQMTQSSPCYN